MAFASTAELRAEALTACRVLTHFRIAEGFGHVSARVAGAQRILITPRRALALVTEAELLELDHEGRQVAGEGTPPLEAAMHLAVYRRRPEVMAIARGHPRHVAAYACAGEPLRVAHGFGANLGAVVPVFGTPYLVASAERAEGIAECARGFAGRHLPFERHAGGRAVDPARLRARAVPGGNRRGPAQGGSGRVYTAILLAGGRRAPPRRRPDARAGSGMGILRGGSRGKAGRRRGRSVISARPGRIGLRLAQQQQIKPDAAATAEYWIAGCGTAMASAASANTARIGSEIGRFRT